MFPLIGPDVIYILEITIGGEKNQNMQILTIGGLKSFGVMRGSKSGLTI